MLVTTRELYIDAQRNRYAIPAPNFIDGDSMKVYLNTAEELKLPIILALAEAHLDLISLEEAVCLAKLYTRGMTVSAVLHLDHGMTLEVIKRAIDLGFTSVMIDASLDDYDTNVKKTKEIVAYAHPRGVVVEAEIGHVGSGINYESHGQTDSEYTTLSDAKRFAEDTNVDSLAISIGTAHGIYKSKPCINFERLREISKSMETPLVLHGGSSSGDENLNRCSQMGITKINIFSDIVNAAVNEINKEGMNNYLVLKEQAASGMKKCLCRYYGIFETKKYL